MDTYKVGTTANSTSTMHKITSKPITMDCFETENQGLEYIADGQKYSDWINTIIDGCENLRQMYLIETNPECKKIYWKELIRWLPESWLQTRTWTADYAVLRNIYHWRKDHKLSEWHSFCDWIKTLPYADELIIYNN